MNKVGNKQYPHTIDYQGVEFPLIVKTRTYSMNECACAKDWLVATVAGNAFDTLVPSQQCSNRNMKSENRGIRKNGDFLGAVSKNGDFFFSPY